MDSYYDTPRPASQAGKCQDLTKQHFNSNFKLQKVFNDFKIEEKIKKMQNRKKWKNIKRLHFYNNEIM